MPRSLPRTLLFATLLLTGATAGATCNADDSKLFGQFRALSDKKPGLTHEELRYELSTTTGLKDAQIKQIVARCSKVAQAEEAARERSEEDPYTRALTCSEVGFNYGYGGGRAARGLGVDIRFNIVVPPRCQNRKDTEAGLRRGVEAAYRDTR